MYQTMKKAICITLLFALTACQGQGANEKTSRTVSQTAVQPSTTMQEAERQFPFPEIPSTLRTPEVRKDYLLRNYWTKFDFADQTLLDNRDVTEQGFVNFIALLGDGQTPKELIFAAMKGFCEAMTVHSAALEKLGKLSKDYLYNPNSPLYNEAVYAHYLRALKECRTTPEGERQRADYLLRLIERNRPGETATDFTYYNKEGKKMTLAETPVQGKRLLLVFYDPECDECSQLMTRMSADSRLSNEVHKGETTVLAIYTEGNNDVWQNTLPTLPANWQAGTDQGRIKEKGLYDLKAMPCLYLLDAQKRILVKDGEYEQIMTNEE